VSSASGILFAEESLIQTSQKQEGLAVDSIIKKEQKVGAGEPLALMGYCCKPKLKFQLLA